MHGILPVFRLRESFVDDRSKSVRVTEPVYKALNTLAGYHDKTQVETISLAIAKLWRETFPGVPMPGTDKARKPRT